MTTVSMYIYRLYYSRRMSNKWMFDLKLGKINESAQQLQTNKMPLIYVCEPVHMQPLPHIQQKSANILNC